MAFDWISPVFDAAVRRQVGGRDDGDQGISRQDAPLAWVAVDGFTSRASLFHHCSAVPRYMLSPDQRRVESSHGFGEVLAPVFL